MSTRTPEQQASEFVQLMWKVLGFAYHDELLEPLTAAFADMRKSALDEALDAVGVAQANYEHMNVVNAETCVYCCRDLYSRIAALNTP